MAPVKGTECDDGSLFYGFTSAAGTESTQNLIFLCTCETVLWMSMEVKIILGLSLAYLMGRCIRWGMRGGIGGRQ